MKLAVDPRDVVWKKVKHLRKQSKVPGVIYGRHLDTPISIVFDKVEFVKAFMAAGNSTPIVLHGEWIDQLVMIYDVQYHPVSDHVWHVDCLAVNKDEKTTAEVPVVLVGESPFESDNLGRVQLIRPRLEVEALPLDLPHHIEVDVSNLTEEWQVLHISDIIVDEKVTLVDDAWLTVISTVAFSEEVEEEEVEVEEGEEGEEGASTEEAAE